MSTSNRFDLFIIVPRKKCKHCTTHLGTESTELLKDLCCQYRRTESFISKVVPKFASPKSAQDHIMSSLGHRGLSMTKLRFNYFTDTST
jgi:hypothetical protein